MKVNIKVSVEVPKIERETWEKITYRTNQYSEGELALVKDISHLLLEDTVHGRYFVVNLNNQIIYLDQFTEEAIVEIGGQKQIKIDFSKLKIEAKVKNNQKKYHFFR